MVILYLIFIQARLNPKVRTYSIILYGWWLQLQGRYIMRPCDMSDERQGYCVTVCIMLCMCCVSVKTTIERKQVFCSILLACKFF